MVHQHGCSVGGVGTQVETVKKGEVKMQELKLSCCSITCCSLACCCRSSCRLSCHHQHQPCHKSAAAGQKRQEDDQKAPATRDRLTDRDGMWVAVLVVHAMHVLLEVLITDDSLLMGMWQVVSTRLWHTSLSKPRATARTLPPKKKETLPC